LIVHLGGSLIPDVEEAGYPSHKGTKCRHKVSVQDKTMLFKTSGSLRGEVNSSHHQAVLRAGGGLNIVARSDDGVIEAIEMEDGNLPFFLLIQWHPERMNDFDNPLSRNILEQFLNLVRANIQT
jgi:putative glutamine amidotransferase